MAKGRILRAAVPACAVVVVLAGLLLARAQSGPLPEAFHVLWSKQQDRFGEGAALSPDGTAVAYIGTTDDARVLGPLLRRRAYDPQTRGRVETDAPLPMEALILADIQSGKETALVVGGGPYELIAQPSFSRDVISHPTFSPDGKRIMFTGSGATIYYPSDIYTVDVEGQNLAQLTHSTHISQEMASLIGKPIYERYYHTPSYSPNGSQILLAISETTAEHPAPRDPETGQLLGGGGGSRRLVAIMKPDGSQMEIVAEGTYCFPYFWSADGQSIYYGDNCGEQTGVIKMNLKTRTARSIMQDLPGRVFGWMAEREWVAFRLEEGPIAWYNFASGHPVFVGFWTVPLLRNVRGEWLELDHFDWSPSGRVLLLRKDPYWGESQLGLIEVADLRAVGGETVWSLPPVRLPKPLWSKREAPGWFHQFAGDYGATACLSEDGKALVYLGGDGGLNLVDIDAGRERVLLSSDSPIGNRRFAHPSFSPDGKRVVFGLRYDDMWSPADIYVVDTVSGHLQPLTVSPVLPEAKRGSGGAHYARFYYNPTFSPDGLRILLDIADSTQLESSLVAVMDADGSDLTVVAKGHSQFWSVDGQSVFYAPGGQGLVRLNVGTGQEYALPDLPWNFLAKLPDRDWVLVSENAGEWLDVSADRMVLGGRSELPIAITVDREPMKLEHAWWSKSCRVLLHYVDKKEELYEVISLTELGCGRP